MDPFSAGAVRGAYDAVAHDYVAAFGDDLASLPVDREVLDRALAGAPDGGWVLEAGCGPAPAAGHLSAGARGLLGVDLSRRMLDVAAGRVAGLRCAQADLRRLPLRDGSCSLAVAYYCLQHLPRSDLSTGLSELARVLSGDGVLAVATHLGDGDVVLDEFLGHEIPPMAGALHDRDELVALLAAAGLEVELERRRDPLPHEYPSQRLYLLCRRRHVPYAGRRPPS